MTAPLKPYKCPRVINGERVVLVILAASGPQAAKAANEAAAARQKAS